MKLKINKNKYKINLFKLSKKKKKKKKEKDPSSYVQEYVIEFNLKNQNILYKFIYIDKKSKLKKNLLKLI